MPVLFIRHGTLPAGPEDEQVNGLLRCVRTGLSKGIGEVDALGTLLNGIWLQATSE